MHTLFDNIPTVSRGSVQFPEFLYVKSGMSRDLAEIVKYYHESVRAVESSHLIVQLITSMNVSLERSYISYVDTAEERGLDLANTLGITSPLRPGEVRKPSVFYTDKVSEVLIAVSESFNLNDAERRWRELQPLRVLRHPYDDLSMPLPDGIYPYADVEGVAVISIDIPMLMFQFRRWHETERFSEENGWRPLTHFVASYVLPNMLYSHLDIALFNRLVNMFNEEKLSDNVRAHPMYVTDWTRKVDDYLEKQCALLKERRFTFSETMISIPMVSANSLFEAMSLPKVTRTKQVNWALILARLPLIKFLVKMNDEAENDSNAYFLNRIRISLREIKNDNALRQALPSRLLREVKDGIKTDVVPYL